MSKAMDDYWKDFELVEKQKQDQDQNQVTYTDKANYKFLTDVDISSPLSESDKRKQIKLDRIKKVNELLNENKQKLSAEYKQDALEKYALINAPIFSEINKLRNNELYEIRKMPEYNQFVRSLPNNQSITIEGYIISRNKVLITREGLPGFTDEESFDYIYDNPAEDITILFGSKEYCDKIKLLKEQIIPWDEFITKYYTV